MNKLSQKIKEKMIERNLSAHLLEKRAGLKPSAVQNIIYGRSKNPSIALIKAIANVLNCTVEDLISEDGKKSSNLSVPRVSGGIFFDKEKPDKKNYPWNQQLYLYCLRGVCDSIYQQNISIEKNDLLTVIEETYGYALDNNLQEPDLLFTNWLIKNICKNV